MKETGDEKKQKAKQDVEQLLGKTEKKKKKQKSELGIVMDPKKGNTTATLEKKPLPGIRAKVCYILFKLLKSYNLCLFLYCIISARFRWKACLQMIRYPGYDIIF